MLAGLRPPSSLMRKYFAACKAAKYFRYTIGNILPIRIRWNSAYFSTCEGRVMEKLQFSQEIGRSVQARRDSLGLTQKQLASIAGVSERLVRSIEAAEAQGVGLTKLEAVLAPLGLELKLVGAGQPKGESASSARVRDDEYEMLLQSAVDSWGSAGGHRV
ncbi:helix-turn-helix domain-containing protein [Adlercreutzia sp. R21]|uniref:helix-turn-helix domain-containing protein n=1 Tax=Adlercreutzia wanghongyangiae TaxID=3111451 RepID=UPI002DBB5751|nr:helix-turn-helix domain-containing protein [Adlercreutzia sp. R21]MEC4184760.1 helix-turn-helix domain-containing protein [Adlercreutzia sp. R21]